MANFLFIYRDSTDKFDAPPSPEEMQAAMALWGAWFQEVGEAVVNGGDGLMPTGKLIHRDGTVTDGPFIEAKELVGGFSIIEADDYDKAVEYAKGCPIIAGGGTVEVRELAGYEVGNG